MTNNRHVVNMADVARHADVSLATVSRALRDLPGVSDTTRQRVKHIAAQLSYVVSPEASGLASGTTRRVAVVAPAINVWFYSTMLASIEGVLRRADMDMLLYHVEGAADRASFFEHLPARRKVDAIILIALPVTPNEAARLELMGVTVVMAGGTLGAHPSVGIDDVEAARTAVDHLIGLGHTAIAMIRTEDPEGAVWAADLARTEGYEQALRRAGLPVREEWRVTVPWGIDGGAVAMDQLLSLDEPPTAVFAYSDEVGVGALRSLRRAGIKVPQQMSVIGVDDHPMAELTDLTTVNQSVEEQGAIAGRLVLAHQDVAGPPARHVIVPTRLVVRGSTAPYARHQNLDPAAHAGVKPGNL